jgi:hypothetical protein
MSVEPAPPSSALLNGERDQEMRRSLKNEFLPCGSIAGASAINCWRPARSSISDNRIVDKHPRNRRPSGD